MRLRPAAADEKAGVKNKGTSLVGLDIESSSIAATEVKSQSDRTAGRTAIVPLESGVMREGDLVNGSTLSDALKDLFGRYRFGKRVRVGVANQRVIVRQGGEGGDEQTVVLDDKGSATVTGDGPFDVIMPDLPDAKAS